MNTPSTAPRVSVAMPVYNPGRMFEGCLRSLFTQTYPHLEFIFVDNGCTDGSPALARQLAQQYNKPITLLTCSTPGQNAALLAGYAAITGDYFQWMDSDDQLQPRKIQAQLEKLESDPSADIAYSDWRWAFRVPGEPMLEVEFHASQYDDFLAQVLMGNWRPPICYLLRRACADRLYHMGALPPELRINTDRVYLTLAALLGMRFVHVPGMDSGVTYFTWNTQQVTRKTGNTSRIVHLQKFYRQLREMVDKGPVTPLSEVHRQCLAEEHQRTRPRPVRVVRQGEQALVELGDGTPARLLTPLQERVLVSLQTQEEPLHREHQARIVCQVFWRRAALRELQRTGAMDFEAVRKGLEKLAGLDPDRPHRLPEDRVTGDPRHVQVFMEHGPLYVPVFAEARLAIRKVLAELEAMGLLQNLES